MGKILDVAIWILYPLIVFCGLTYFGVRLTAIVLLVFAGRRFIVLLLSHRSTSRLVLIQATLMAIIIAGAVSWFPNREPIETNSCITNINTNVQWECWWWYG